MSEDDNLKKSEESKDELKEKLSEAEEKIESVEKKLEEQEKKTSSIKHYKSEGTTLVLSIVVGLLGFMGVGHMYLGRVRRGIIILIVGVIGWAGIFIPFVMLGVFSELEGEISDQEAMLAVMAGFGVAFVVFGIGMIALFIWQILNARKLCKEYNEYYEKQGKPPW